MGLGEESLDVSRGQSLEASRLGLRQERGENLRKYWGNSGLLAEAGNVGGGVR